MKKIITNSEKETIAFGEKFAGKIKGGTVLGLVGNLGAGKTQFVKGLAKGLGIKKNITSPTFVVMKEYNWEIRELGNSGIGKFIHIDCYRLTNAKELLDLGLQEYIDQNNNIIVIEWADRVKNVLPKNTVWIEFEVDNTDNAKDERVIMVR